METTVLKEIIAFLFGRKYYACILNTRGVDRYELSSYIFRNKEDVEVYKRKLSANISFQHIETVSFRSRKDYVDLSPKENNVTDNPQK